MATADGPDVATLLSESNLNDVSPMGLVDTSTGISDLIDIIANLPNSPPSLYLDLEGIQLSRHGSISILQIHICTDDRT
jgi:exonuclease 3'-5' domain-containing protein 1